MEGRWSHFAWKFGVWQIGVKSQWAKMGIVENIEINDEIVDLATYSLGHAQGVYVNNTISCSGHLETIYDLGSNCWYEREHTWSMLFGWESAYG